MHSQFIFKGRAGLAALLGTGLLLAASGCDTRSPSSPAQGSAGTPAASAASGATDKGVGPVSEVKLEAKVDPALAGKGKAVFEAKCTACHKFDERYVGPALRGVTQRRSPEWIMNMVLNPGEMTQKNETAKTLLGEYMTQMTFQNVTQDETRSVLEYFRQQDAAKK